MLVMRLLIYVPESMYCSITPLLTLAACVVISPLFIVYVVDIYMTLAVDITDGRGLIMKSIMPNSCQRRAR